MVMRTKIKEIIATGGNLGMGCGEIFFFLVGGVFFIIWLLVCSVHLDSLLVVDCCTNISMDR